MFKPRLFAAAAGFVGLALAAPAGAHPSDHVGDPTAEYIANEGVLVTDGGVKILFDPLFHESFGTYRTPSEEQRRAMLAGEPPFDGVDAVFISHAHDDHFAADEMNAYLAAQSETFLVAPAQAVAQMRAAAGWQADFEARISSIDLDFGDAKTRIYRRVQTRAPDGEETNMQLVADAFRIPHAGWPGRADVENIVYRVTLSDRATVMHLGDADPRDEHYAPYEKDWAERRTDMGFPPYWFFSSAETHAILKDRLRINHAVGVHVPVAVPPGLEAAREQFGIDFFSEPGETRTITIEKDETSP